MSDLPFRQPKEHSEIPSVGPVSVYHLEAYHHLRRHAAVDYAHPHSVLARRLHKQAQNEVLEGNRGAKNEVRKLTARVENAKRKKDQTRAQDKIDRELLRDTDEPLSETSEEMELPKKPRKAYRERLQDVHPDELELPEPKQLPAGPLILLCVVSVSCSSIDFPPSDLLKTIHTHARDYYMAEGQYRLDDRPNKKNKVRKNLYAAFDGSALVAISVLLEEYTKHLVSQRPSQSRAQDMDLDEDLSSV